LVVVVVVGDFLPLASARSGLAGRSFDSGLLLLFGVGEAFFDAAGDMARPMAL